MDKRLIVSVAGIRGTYPEVLTLECALRFGAAFGRLAAGRPVVLGRDTRQSGPVLAAALSAGLLSAGQDVVDVGVCPTPAVGYIIERLRPGAAGAMVTASHNPLPYNGIKFFSCKGTFLNQREGERLRKELVRPRRGLHFRTPGAASFDPGLVERYLKAAAGMPGAERIRARRFHVVVDACNGVGVFCTERFLRLLGCRVTMLNVVPPGVFAHPPEPVPEHLGGLGRVVLRARADIGFAQDPDGDRLAVVSERGVPIGEELTLVISVDAILARTPGPVAANLSTTALLDELAVRYRVPLRRTKIGEVHVVEAMKKTGAVIGGEGNGGVIWPELHYGRDSFAGMFLILRRLAEERSSVSGLVQRFPAFCMIKEKLALTAPRLAKLSAALDRSYRGAVRDTTDGLKIMRDDGWIHLRASGTEPVVRMIIEGKDRRTAEAYRGQVRRIIKREAVDGRR